MRTKYGRNRDERQPWFRCVHCGQPIVPQAYGTEHRNHCPSCLWSKHVDDSPGDRAAGCDGAMEPVAIWVKRGGEWSIIHRCSRCGTLHSNRIAGDDNELVLTSLAVKAISQPSFPLDRLAVVDIRRSDVDGSTEAVAEVDLGEFR